MILRAVSVSIVLAFSLALASAEPIRTNTVSAAIASPDFGYDIHNGITNRIARIATVDPRFIWGVYEDGVSGRKIPRAELPSQLRARYPYDPEEAADATRARVAENRALLAEYKRALQQKEQELTAQIAALNHESNENEKEIKNVGRKLKTVRHSKKFKSQKLKLLDAQNTLRQRKNDLESRLQRTRAELDKIK
ncbi:MAG TPA: hypothetical protein VIV82_08710 [Verrucomicrobiae bacterium]|jgi:hypothetical protein